MNPYIQSILLGIVEGLTEFLPVSSTAHLRIAEALMKIPLDDAYWKMYTIVIQLGAILALALLYLGRIFDFLRTFPKGENGNRTWLNHPISLTLIAFACTSVPALLLHKWSEKNLGSLTVMALALLIGGIVMWVIDSWSNRYEPNTLDVEEMSLGQAVWIGLCQTLSAIFPGTSRSMSTIAAGQLVGLRPRHHELRALDYPRHRYGGLLRCRARRCGVVPPLGAQAWVCDVRGLPHPTRHGAADLRRTVHRELGCFPGLA